ncbi:TnpV protein [Enterococcus faecalis]|nr:TnpV protein [Enterococcus faecalis]
MSKHPTINEMDLPEVEMTEADSQPLKEYGKIAMSYLQENNPLLIQEKMADSSLMTYLHEKEQWALDYEYEMYQTLKEKNPVPETDNILNVEQHTKLLLNQAKELTTNELIQTLPVNTLPLNDNPYQD